MQKLIVVVGYFPHIKTYYAKIAKNLERANFWRQEWEARGGVVVIGDTYYKTNRELAYKLLKEKLVKEIKNSHGNV